MYWLRKPVFAKLFWLYLIAVILAVILPSSQNLDTGGLNSITLGGFRGDYVFHALGFLPWAFFAPSFKLNIWVWLMPGLALAAGSEGLHYFLPFRSFNVNDALANVLGIALGFAALVVLNKSFSSTKNGS